MQRFDVLSRKLNVFAPHFLEASAGTGKTFAIEHLFIRLLLEGSEPLNIEQILVMTFTRAATRELKLRIRRNLWKTERELKSKAPTVDYLCAICEKGEEAIRIAIKRIEAALICYDSAPIFTLHGFCYRALKEGAFEAGISLEVSDPDRADAHSLYEPFVREHLLNRLQMPAYSPMQVRLLLKKYQDDPEKMVVSLMRKIESGKEIASFPPFSDYYNQFIAEIALLPSVEKSKWVEDAFAILTQYRGMTDRSFPKEIALWGEILTAKSCTCPQFDQLLKEESFLKRISPENLKVRAKPLNRLHYPGLIDQMRTRLLPSIEGAADPSKIALRVAKDLQAACFPEVEERELFSPDLLLKKMEEVLQKPAFLQKLQKKYRAVIVDEFQDTDPIQWKIIQELFLPSVESICLVGDPKQSIYAFRSADVYTYLQAAEQLGPGAKKHLDTNFRSTPALVRGLNLLFSKAERGWMPLPALETVLSVPMVHSGRPEEEQHSSLKSAVHFFLTPFCQGRSRQFPPVHVEEQKIFPYIASEIARLHVEEGVGLNEIAILIRDRFQAQRVIDHLMRSGISAQFKRGASLAESDAFFAFYEILQSILSPRDLSRLKGALGSALIGWNEERLSKGGEDPLLLHAKVQMLQLHSILIEKGFGRCFQSFLETAFEPVKGSVLEQLLSRGEISLYSDLRKLAELCVEEEVHRGLKGGQFLDFMEELAADAHREDPRLRIPAQEESSSVIVMTIHQSKGLEFDTVFALGVICRRKVGEEAVVRRSNLSMVTLFDPEDPDCQRAVQEEDAEKMRQLYVALTRAKQRLYIPYPIDQEGKLSDVGEGSPLELLFARFAEPVQDLLASLSPHISFEVVEGDYPLKAIPIPSAPVLQPPEILPLPQANLRLLSFSALAKKGGQRALQKPPEGDLLTPHHLPLGSETGVAIHSLFEKIFQRGLHTLSNEAELIRTIDREISSTALDRWKPVFFPWIRAILTHPLGAFSLSQLSPSQVQQEMEFHFSFPQGVMKGFADLFFEYQGKYYLLDWKSNYLGPSNTDYSEENMIAAMSENDYFLQARIYKEALSRYVKLFDNRPFDQLFGGAIYYFVRGVAPYCFIPTSFQEPPC